MTERDRKHHVVIEDGNRLAAAADVITPERADGTVRVSLRAESGHITPGTRSSLVDLVLDLPGVRDSARLEAVVPLGDHETLHRLRERCTDVRVHAAGSSALVDACLPRHDRASQLTTAAGWSSRQADQPDGTAPGVLAVGVGVGVGAGVAPAGVDGTGVGDGLDRRGCGLGEDGVADGLGVLLAGVGVGVGAGVCAGGLCSCCPAGVPPWVLPLPVPVALGGRTQK
jgi:hypothetical protein